MQKTPIVCLLAILSVFISHPVVADDAVVCDTGNLSIGAWQVHLSRHTLRSGQPDKAYLKISKQTPGLDIRAGFLILNYRLIPLSRFLNGPETTFQRKIKLRQTNRLRVFLIGSPGASIRITVHAAAENQPPPPSVAMSATPQTIDAGATSTLSWSCDDAQSCIIAPGIGSVDTVGSMAVSPAATTTYTLTATGSGGSASSAVTVTVNPPPPTVTLSATPLEITSGQSASLTWSTSNATTCVITPNIGSVDPNGSVSVTPAETTIYEITGSGAGGAATAEVTVVVIQPTPSVEISVSPATIGPGEIATLAWRSTHAESCAIEPEIGVVDPSGSLAVSPMETTTYTITATGYGGDEITDSTTIHVNPVTLSILAPINTQIVRRHDVLVEGTVSNSSAKETGVVVNGMPAVVFDGRFVANHISLDNGENRITVKATDSDGNTKEETITVYGEFTENFISLSADAETGIDTLETAVRVNGPLNYLRPSIAFTGPAAVTFSDSPEENVHPVKLDQAGIYYFSAEVSDTQGDIYSDTVAIVVMSAEALDGLLKAKWTDMKTTLMSGDIEQALQFHHERYREKYTAIYNALGHDLPSLVQQMQDISQIWYNDGTTKYRIRQNHDINGQFVTITYYIYFSRGENGLWLIEKY